MARKPSRSRRKRDEVCAETGGLTFCLRCLKRKTSKARKRVACDFHQALFEYRERARVTDRNPFRLAEFCEKTDWTKIETSCIPETTILLEHLLSKNELRIRGAAVV